MFWQMALRASVRLWVEPLEEGYPLGEIGLGPGVVEPALARLVAGETVAQRGGAGVDLFHVPHNKEDGVSFVVRLSNTSNSKEFNSEPLNLSDSISTISFRLHLLIICFIASSFIYS